MVINILVAIYVFVTEGGVYVEAEFLIIRLAAAADGLASRGRWRGTALVMGVEHADRDKGLMCQQRLRTILYN